MLHPGHLILLTPNISILSEIYFQFVEVLGELRIGFFSNVVTVFLV